jgi:RimJ/RimL family protein N-acetyltransferase
VLNLPRLICLIHPDNVSSQHVATRIGMTFEREGKDEKGAYLMYSMNKP